MSSNAALSAAVGKLLLAEAPIRPETIEVRLRKHFERESFTTALYILNFKSTSTRPYSYVPPHSGCARNTFVSRTTAGLAWADLRAGADVLDPGREGQTFLPPPPLPSSTSPASAAQRSFSGVGVYPLASFIHRSTEALVPAPASHHDRPVHDAIHFTLVTVCNLASETEATAADDDDDERKDKSCADDPDAVAAAHSLVRLLHSGFRRVTFDATTIDAKTDVGMMMAWKAAKITHGKFSSPPSPSLSIKALAQWLPSSTKLRDALTVDTSASSSQHIALVSFQLDEQDAGLGFAGGDQGQSIFATRDIRIAKAATYGDEEDSPIGGETDAASLARDLSLPWVHAVPALFIAKPPLREATRGRSAEHSLRCGGRQVEPSHSNIARRIRSELLRMMWHDCEDSAYYSSSSRRDVLDYLWSSVMDDFNQGAQETDLAGGFDFSFVGYRCGSRHAIVSSLEKLLDRLSAVVTTVNSFRPRVDARAVLGAPVHTSPTQARFRNRYARGSETTSAAIPEGAPLQNLLNMMGQAATEFSHIEFDAAEGHLRNADTLLRELEAHVARAEQSRVGRVVCVGDEEYGDVLSHLPDGMNFDPDAVGGSQAHPDDAGAETDSDDHMEGNKGSGEVGDSVFSVEWLMAAAAVGILMALLPAFVGKKDHYR